MTERECKKLIKATEGFRSGDEKGWTKGMDILIFLINEHRRKKTLKAYKGEFSKGVR